MQGLADKEDKLEGAIERVLVSYAKKINECSLQLDARSPSARLENVGMRLNRASELLLANMSNAIESKRLMLGSAVGRLESVNPMSVIKRGYSMTLDESGNIVSSIRDVKTGDGISVRVRDGNIFARVECKTEENNVGKN